MAKNSDYEITTFQRQPGLWRASVMQTDTVATYRKMRSILTAEDSNSERDAEIAATRMINEIE